MVNPSHKKMVDRLSGPGMGGGDAGPGPSGGRAGRRGSVRLAEALGFPFQGNGLPAQVTDALPFVVALIALIVARKRSLSSWI